MSLNLDAVISAFGVVPTQQAENIWKKVFSFLRTVTDRQAEGITSVVLKRSKGAQGSVLMVVSKTTDTPSSVVRAVSRSHGGLPVEYRGDAVLLNYAIDTLLVSTEKTDIHPRDFKGLFETLSAREFDEILSPAVCRALRRSASRTLPNIASILDHCRSDMSSSATQIMDALVESFKSTDLIPKSSEIVSNLFRKSSNSAVKQTILTQLAQAFPKMGTQSVDVAVSRIMEQICIHEDTCTDSPTIASLIASPLVSGLLRQLRQTTSDETKIAIATALGSVLRFALSGGQQEFACKAIKEELCGVLADTKKLTDPVREAVVLAIEKSIQADKTRSMIGSSVISLDLMIPFLSLLISGRQSARSVCLASWAIVLHACIVDKVVDKRLPPIFTQAVSSDITFLPLVEDSYQNKRLLRLILTLSIQVPNFPLYGTSEMETISFPTVSEPLKNRFPVCAVRIIAQTSFSSFSFNDVSKNFANRLVHALYEVMVNDESLIPGHLLRIAMTKIASLAKILDPEWLGLFVVLCHHSRFTSKRISTDKIWNQYIKQYIELDEFRLILEPLIGWVFQGSHIPAPDLSGFRQACALSVSKIVSIGLGDESIVGIAKFAMDRISPRNIDACKENLGVFFCPQNVVWRDETGEWIPSSDNTLAPGPAAPRQSSSGVTREDMMRMALQEQSVIRKKVSETAASNTFAIDVLTEVVNTCQSGELTDRIVGSLTEKFDLYMPVVSSPLTSSSMKDLLTAIVSSSAVTCMEKKSLVPDLIYAVALGDVRLVSEEEWVEFFNSFTDSTRLTGIEIDLTNSLIKVALNPRHTDTQFRSEVALACVRMLTNQIKLGAEFNLGLLLENVSVTSKISPGMFATAIGSLLRAIAPRISSESEIRLLTSVGITDEPKLFKEVILALPSIPIGSEWIDTFNLLAEYEESTKSIARKLLSNAKIVSHLVELLGTEPLIQKLSAESLAWACAQPGANIHSMLELCCDKYREATVSGRIGYAMGLAAIGRVGIANDLAFLTHLVQFVIGTALSERDLSNTLREELFTVLQESLTANGESHATDLICVTEKFIGSSFESAALAVPIVLGLLCKFLPPENEKVGSVRTKLVAELLSAEQSVQTKIATVLPPLLKMSDDVSKYLETFLNTALTTADPRARYGAALGVGAAVKAQGVSILRQLEVLKRVQEAAEDKSSPDKRQGAIAVYGGLSLSLGRLFEPYVAQVLPVMLVAFSDNQAAVRDASNLAASQIMANLSTHGIKLVLPSLLGGVEDLQWRTKLGSIKLLSAMVNCAPKQLAACLPKVVPALSEVATDTHSKVREAACASLVEVGQVIGNPEIKSCASKLIASLTDPANDALRQEALDVLLSISFVHSLDAASLALVVPVMLRATRERRSEIKRKGAQILGSIAVLSADPVEGLGPYMSRIIPALQDVLVDPIPDVRATAAKALGTISRALPDVIVAEVLPWLFKTLKEADSQVERSGAAHGLSEVLVELGPEHFTAILPEVVANAVNPSTNPEAREGYMGLFVFLPGVMKAAFVPHIDVVFPMLIQGLSDILQPVREVAQRAATALCVQFAATHATLLLPSLERGLFARDWRARQASVQLTGQTLEQLMKHSKGGNRDNLLESQVPLTQERRSYMLAMLYIVRSDPNQTVNQCAQQVWKNVVSNTPRTLRLILPILVRLLINNLSSSEEETRQLLAGRCLGDLVGKLGERVLPDMMPILIDNMSSADAMTRAGVCVGLADIVNAASRQLLQEYFSIMFPAVRAALCDESQLVRSKAGTVIGTLYTALGNTTINNTVPQIMETIVNSQDAAAVAAAVLGLEQVVAALPKEMLLIVLDTLASTDNITSGKLKGIETIALAPPLEVARYVTRIVPYLIVAYQTLPEETLHCGNALFGMFNKHSCHLAMIELIRGLGDTGNGRAREACASLLMSGIRCSPLEVIGEYVDTLTQVLLRGMMTDSYQPAMEACLISFGELVTKFTKESMIKYMGIITGVVDESGSAIPGLALPKAFETLWPIYQQALMFGNMDSREAAATGLPVLLEHTPLDRLKPNAIKVTGPLIRVLGDKYPAPIKMGVLKSLKVLIERLEVALKPFVPQLQTTYQKCVQDTDTGVRELAEESQALLTRISAPRVVPQ